MIDLFFLAWKGLRHQPLRSLLTIVAVIIGIAAVFTLISAIQGLDQSVRAEFLKLGTNKINIIPGTIIGTNYGGDYLTEEDVRAVENTPGIRYVLTLQTAQATVEIGQEKATITIFGINPENFSRAFENILGGYIKEGRVLDRQDKGKYVALIGYAVAEDAFDKKILPGSTIYINGKPFRVIGVMKKTGGPIDAGAYIPKAVFEEITGQSGKYVRIMAETAEGTDPKEVAEKIKHKLKLLHGVENFRVTTSEQTMQRISQVLQMLGAFLVSIGAISLVIGAVGIMNTMYMSVTERIPEIGIMKAVGATKQQIMLIFLLEAGVIGAVGGLLGEMLGFLITQGIEKYIQANILEGYRAYYSPVLVVGLLAFSFVVGVVAGIMPAKSGADLDPVEAMRR